VYHRENLQFEFGFVIFMARHIFKVSQLHKTDDVENEATIY